MRTLRWTLATAALTLLAPLAFADGPPAAGTHFKISVSDAGTVEFDLEELAVGESRHFTTDTGKPVDITRTEAGYELTVDGEKLDVVLNGDELGSMSIASDGDGTGERRMVKIRKQHGEDGAMVVTEGAGDGHVVRIKHGPGGHDGEPEVIVVADGDDGEGGTRVVKKRIAVSGGEGDGDIQVKVMDGDLDEIDLEALAAEAGDGAHVVVVKKKVQGEAGGQPKRIVIRIEKHGEHDQDDDQH